MSQVVQLVYKVIHSNAMYVLEVTEEVHMIQQNAIPAMIKIVILVYQSQALNINMKISVLIAKVVFYCFLIFHADLNALINLIVIMIKASVIQRFVILK
jgi:hypothetical protein